MHRLVKDLTLRGLTAAVLGGLLGHLANGHSIRVWNGVEILPGSAFSYMVVALFGPWWGGLAAGIAGARTVAEWGHPFALILHVLEIIIVGFLLRARIPLATGSAAYWTGLGLPLVWGFYGVHLHLSWRFVWMVALGDFLPSLICALITHLIISSHRLRPLWRWMSANPPALSLREDIFAGTLLVGTLPLFAAILFNGTVLRQRGEEGAKVRLARHAETVASCLDFVGQLVAVELTARNGVARETRGEGDPPQNVEISPGIRLLWQNTGGDRLSQFPVLHRGEFDLPLDRLSPSQVSFAGNRRYGSGSLRVNPALACPIRADNLDAVRVAIVQRDSGRKLSSYMAGTGAPPKSGFVGVKALLAAMKTASVGTLQFRRMDYGANPFQKAAYLGGHAMSKSGLTVIFYQPAAQALGPATYFQMWAVLMVVVAAIASAAFAFWLGRRITSPVACLRKHLETMDLAPAHPIVNSASPDVAVEMRPLWNGVQELQRRTYAALAKSEDSAAAAVAAAKQKSEFLATISHEIRTPLNCILGMVPRVGAEKLSNGQCDAVALIERSGEHLVSILNDVLDFSRIEHGQLELRKEPFETVSLIEEAFEMLVPGAIDKGLYFTWICSPSLPAFCQGDPLRIKQILINIAGNAVKFTSAGSVEIDVAWTAGADPDGDGHIVCTVRDTGPGIPDAHLHRIFQPFWQLTDTVGTPPNVGTGLGLSIVKRILTAMGGEIRIDTTVGIGTTATVSIPLGVLRQPPNGSPMSVVIAGAPSRIRDSLASHVHFLGCSNEVQNDLPSGPGEGKGLIVEDSLAAGMPAHSAGSLQSFIDAGWKVAVYQTYPCHFQKDYLRHTPGVECLAVPPSLRKLREACAQAGGSLASTPAAAVARDRPARVLVAEDNADNRIVIELLLNRLGCQPRIVDDGTAAWAALQAASFDFAILDLRMPGIDGLALARRIRQEMPAPPRLIALTASAFESDRKLCAEAGFDAFLSKPLREVDLRSILTSGEPAPAAPIGPDGAWAVKNLSSLRALCGDKADVMIRTVLVDTGSWLASPVQDLPAESVVDRAHKLAGSAMLIGAAGLAGALKRIEEIALTDPAQLKESINIAKTAWDRAVRELELCPATTSAPK